MKVYCVYLGDVFLKCFKDKLDASVLCNGLQIFLVANDMDIDLARITEEVI